MTSGAVIEVVGCAIVDRHLAVLLRDPARGTRASLPWKAHGGTSIPGSVASLVRAGSGRAPTWMSHAGVVVEGAEHPSGAALTVVMVATVPMGTPATEGHHWAPVATLPPLAPRQSAAVDLAIATLRDRMDLEPVAFRLLPSAFTLTELQQTYELLLGRRLHKASFRRALLAASLVEPTGDWRSEGRGRPAQLFLYAPRRRRGARRPVRFELLG